MSHYRKKPVVIEAKQWRGLNHYEIFEFIGADNHFFSEDQKDLYILTLEGTMKASIGDFIIKGVHGEFYPCKPEIFEKTYEFVE